METNTEYRLKLASSGARFDDNGNITGFGDQMTELLALSESAIAVPLLESGLICISGSDAGSFLDAQLTSDVESLGPGRAGFTGYCTPKGRLLATALMYRQNSGYRMLLPTELAQDLATRLQRYVLRAKVKIEICSGDVAAFGVAGPTSASRIAESLQTPAPPPLRATGEGELTIVGLSSSRYIVISAMSLAQDIWERLARNTSPAGSDLWELQNIRNGYASVTKATQEAFLPQMLGLERYAAVSFDKGCYPGQEIVARTRYLGELKRILYYGKCDAQLRPGEGIVTGSGKSAGTIVNAASDGAGNWEFLAVMQKDVLDEPAFTTTSGNPVDLIAAASTFIEGNS